MRLVMSRLYVILDAGMLTEPAGEFAKKLTDAGVRLLQYRDKHSSARELWSNARAIAQTAHAAGCAFFVNDRPDIAHLAGADGVHVGQEDLDVEQAREVAGPGRLVGVSTHNLQQFEQARGSSADYIAVGPIFPTASKANPDPVVGMDFVRRVRPLTRKPIVAIGGITLERAPEVIAAGADSVAVISGILQANDPAAQAREFLRRLEEVEPAKHQQG
jgi:thiamine-phosphate pyrophosphorylase